MIEQPLWHVENVIVMINNACVVFHLSQKDNESFTTWTDQSESQELRGPGPVKINFVSLFFSFVLAFDFCRFCMIIRFFHPRHNGQWPPSSKDFYPRFYPLHLFSYLNSLERASIFPFECSVQNKGTTGTIFTTSLAWCGPWLGIEPRTSRTRS